MRRCRFLLLVPALTALLAAQAPRTAQQPEGRFDGISPPKAMQRWTNRVGTFQLDLPADWRQLAPGEALRLRDVPAAPAVLGLSQPNAFYAVGPVERWLAADFSGPWLYIVEGNDEWHVTDSFAADLAAAWQRRGEATGERHELTDVRRATIGEQQVEVVMATRTTTPTGGRPPVKSLDVYAPSYDKQVCLSFCCAPAAFDSFVGVFGAWARSITFARVRKGQTSLGDRLWTPVLTGLAVGAIFYVLYRHTRARR